MGRGISKTGSGGGGKPPIPQNTVQLPQPEQVAAGNVLPKGGVPFSDFESMTDSEKAQVITDAINTGTPMFLDDSSLQRFAYFTGMNDVPKVVSDSQLDSIRGHELFRTVNDAYDSKKDIGYTSTDIAKQITDGDFTMYSDSGGSAYGKAIYFASSVSSSSCYAGSAARHPAMIRAKITGGKSISDGNLSRMYSNALSSRDPIAVACSRTESSSARNLFALAKGYDIITTSNYHMVLNRRCLTVSSKIKTGVTGYTTSW